jgi:hypothetical protein
MFSRRLASRIAARRQLGKLRSGRQRRGDPEGIKVRLIFAEEELAL